MNLVGRKPVFWHKFVLVIPSFLALSSSAAAQTEPPRIAACAVPAVEDQDHDGLSDRCETALAGWFAPVLVVRSAGCNWESGDSGRLRGGYFFIAQPVDSMIRIAYLPAYFRDCGWSGPKCWLPWVNCAPHDGDSEFIAIDVRLRNGASAAVDGVFLSAHCFGRSSSSCRWYRGQDLRHFEWFESAPVVWVAEGRHANYPSRQTCDAGHHGIDTCDRNHARFRFPISVVRNLGSRAFPIHGDGCVSGHELGRPEVVAETRECFWTADASFRGWQGTGRGVTGYARYLDEIARY